MSATPSPVTSATATRAPPPPGSGAVVDFTDPSAAYTTTAAGPPAPAPPAYTGRPPGVSVVTRNVRAWPASSGGPAEIAVAHPGAVCGPDPAGAVWSGPAANDGASLTGPTVTVNVRVTVAPPSSRTVTVIVAVS